MTAIDYVVFDLGGVLVDWDPRYLYRKIFDTEAEVEAFLRDIFSHDWILASDAGRPLDDCIAELVARHPDYEGPIRAYRDRWHEMVTGPINGTVEILRKLKSDGVALFVLSNWSHDTWPRALEMFEFLDWFDGLVVSGLEGVAKPEAEIFRRLEGHGVDLGRALFIDDRADNIAAAEALGMTGIHFTGAADLSESLSGLKLI